MTEREHLAAALFDSWREVVPGQAEAVCPMCDAPLEVGLLPGGFVRLGCFDSCTEEELRRWVGLPPPRQTATTDELWRRMMLARDLEAWGALVAGESVPESRLDWQWANRFGLLGKLKVIEGGRSDVA